MNNHPPYDISIIVACYNEEGHLEKNIKEIEENIDQLDCSYEFIFIDDCSQDNTRDIIKIICKDKYNYRYIFHEKNVGRGGTVREGLLLSNSKYSGFLDIDLEVSAVYLPNIILNLKKGYDFVSINRVYDSSSSITGILRTIQSRVNKKLMRSLLKINSEDSETGYKFFNTETMKEIIKNTIDKKWFWDSEIILRAEHANKKIKFIPGLFIRNKNKKSTVNMLPDTILHIKSLLKFRKKLKSENNKYGNNY